MYIDKFKWVNDTYGHLVGDVVIKKLVDIIHKRIENHNTWAARYGGDEFLITFYNDNYNEVKNICDDIIQDIHDIEFNRDGQSFHVSVSIGIYQYNPEEDSYTSLLEKVDAKMYEEKKKKE
jgi:diguanylate cyclase (GGDEF)-like protein